MQRGKGVLFRPRSRKEGKIYRPARRVTLVAKVASAFFIMRTYGHLWDQIISFENLYCSFLEAKRHKRFDLPVLDFAARLEENLVDIAK